MTRYWVVALIVVVVALLFAVRRFARRSEVDDEHRAPIPHGDGEREPAELDLPLHDEAARTFADGHIDDPGDLDDTAPAVLSPPEWTPPKSASNGSRR